MKPTHRVFCKDCNRSKILFETEKKALNFIKFNAEQIAEEGGKLLKRAYFCPYCCGYHVTSTARYREGLSSTNSVLEAYEEVKKKPQLDIKIDLEKPNGEKKTLIVQSIVTPELKAERTKMRNLYLDIKELLSFYSDIKPGTTNEVFLEALKLEKKAFDNIKCDDIKAKTNVETILKQYLNYD